MSGRMLGRGSFRCEYAPDGTPTCRFLLLARPPVLRSVRLSQIRRIEVWFGQEQLPPRDLRLLVDRGAFDPAALAPQIDRYWGAFERAQIVADLARPLRFTAQSTVTLAVTLQTRCGLRTWRESIPCIPATR